MTKPIMIQTNRTNDAVKGYIHWCPGCNQAHRIIVRRNGPGRVWSFNYDFTTPTFSPSITHSVIRTAENMVLYCQYRLEDGKLHYTKDCFHPLKGKVVELEPFPDGYLTEDEIHEIVAYK